MTTEKKPSNGMFTGKKIFFHRIANNNLKFKIIQILHRLEAIIEPFYNNEIDMVIIDGNSDSSSLNKMGNNKRKFSAPLPLRAKKIRLMSHLKDGSVPVDGGDCDSERDEFLTKVISMGCKVKTIKVLWSWLSQYHSALVENCYVEDDCADREVVDYHNKVKKLCCPSLKILDPFGGCRPLVKENCDYQVELFEETCSPLAEEITKEEVKRSNSRRSLRRSKFEENSGVCECCRKQYLNLATHLTEECHQTFVNNIKNFHSIDKVIGKIEDIDYFFNNRLTLRQKYRISKTKIQESVKKEVSQQFVIEKEVALSSSSSSCSSCSSSSSYSSSNNNSLSSSSSNNNNNDYKHKPIIFTSTPNIRHEETATFSQDSISSENMVQSELSAHVSGIVSHLHVSTELHSDNAQLLSAVDTDESPNEWSFVSPFDNNTNNISTIIEQRFKWCKTCGRNHIHINEAEGDNYHCKFTPINKKKQSDCESNNSDKENVATSSNNVVSPQQPIDSGSRLKRRAAVAADKGIKNVNKLMNSNIKQTISCLERSASSNEFNPRVRISNLKFSPEKIIEVKNIFREINK